MRIEPTDIHAPEAATLLREYFAEMVGRYRGRPPAQDEVDAAIAEDPSDELVPPHGTFLVAAQDGVATGCVGMEFVDERIAELKRLYVRPAARGTGLGRALLAELERLARGRGVRTLRLDTRSDLVQARALYVREGYLEVPAFSDGPYAQHWYAKELGVQQSLTRSETD